MRGSEEKMRGQVFTSTLGTVPADAVNQPARLRFRAGDVAKRFIPAMACLLLLGVFCSAQLYAQVTSAAVLGTVMDQTGAVIPNATITLKNLETGVTATTHSNGAGDYIFNLVPPGRYTVIIVARGFRKVVYPSISLAAGDRVRENGRLLAGSATETVTVHAASPLLQTQSASLTSVVTRQAVQDLPLNGRNFINLVQLLPGVNQGQSDAISSGQRPDNRAETSTVVANGMSDLFNNYMIDGMDNNEREQGFLGVRPSVDAIAEVKVVTNLYNAELGRTAGAVVNIITKSGTNQYHGSAYEFFRNDILDARNFFTTVASGVHKPEYRENQFGGSLGGPIVKNKTFFFGDVEDSRVVQGQPTGLMTVPTAFEENSGGTNFTDAGGGIVPASAINPQGMAYFKMYPAPNTGGAGATIDNYVASPNKVQNALTADGRIDHNFKNGDRLFARYSYNDINTLIQGAFPQVTVQGTGGPVTVDPGGNRYQYPGTAITRGDNIAFSYTHLLKPNLLMHLKAGYTRINIQALPLDYGRNVSTEIGIVNANTPLAPETTGLMPLFVGGYGGIGDISVPILDVNNTFVYMGSLMYTHRTHNIQIGGQLIRRQLNYFQNNIGLGAAAFTGRITGNTMEDLVTGHALAYWRWNALVKPGYRTWEYAGYAQDNWRVTQSLTLDLGLRYSVFTAFTEAHGRYDNFNYPTLSLISGKQSPHIGVDTSYANLAPRFGFAQSLWKNTVLRGGFGISYYPDVMQQAISGLTNPPYNFNTGIVINPHFWPTMVPPTPSSTTNLSGSLVYLPKNFNTAYVNQFNLMLQHLFGATAVTVGGVGELVRHQQFAGTINNPLPTGPYPNDATQGPGPVPTYLTASTLPNVSQVVVYAPWATTNYYALQAVVARRFTRNLAFNANYTWAHGLSDSGLSGSGMGIVAGQIPTNPRYDYGNSQVDIRQRFSTYWDYHMPFARNATGIKAAFLRGWDSELVLWWQTGTPFTVTNGFINPHGVAQINLPGSTADRPDLVPGVSYTASSSPSLSHWLNLAAFTPQPAGTPGDARNDQFYGPHHRMVNMSFLKNLQISKRLRAQFRAECFNVTNTPNFNNPNSSISGWNPGPEHNATNPISKVGLLPGDMPTDSGGFGTVTSAWAPRQFQFAMKFLF